MADPLDELFTAVPTEFVARRDELVKQLRAERRRDEANEIKRLRRPTASVWALNQLAREHPDEVAELLVEAVLVKLFLDRQLDLLGFSMFVPGVRLTLWLAGVIIMGAGLLATWSFRSIGPASSEAGQSVGECDPTSAATPGR